MTGTIALEGGAPFAGNDDLDRRLLAAAAADTVVVLPTADAFESPERLVEAAQAWGGRLGVTVEPLMVLRRTDASVPDVVATVAAARAVYLVGDSSLHLRSVVKDTPLWDALCQVVASGGVVVGIGQCAAALCDPMIDQRGGAFTLGLGMVSGVAVVAESDTLSSDRLQRTLKLADVPIVTLATGAAALWTSAGWELVGDAVAHGDLPS